MVPSTHKIELRSKMSRWKNNSKKLERMHSKLQRKQQFANSETVQALWSIALAVVSSLALSTA